MIQPLVQRPYSFNCTELRYSSRMTPPCLILFSFIVSSRNSLLFFSPFKSTPRFYTTTSADGQTYNIATQIYMVYLTLFSSSPTVTSSRLKYLNFLRGSSNTIMTINKLERKQCSAGECHLSTTRIAV